ncbi:cupin domain-containing protein [Rhizorhabdus sp.]|uniref:cupin domain-containing protein n=1 Tax=Rhizorhabdus sp. TaxID=1968843 RepID=UPI001B7CA026|nr:hypothetical protein [Rhizorhabdus sp.]MBP8233230.1 hypothetical protein [Rhizorhabdus sp.]
MNETLRIDISECRHDHQIAVEPFEMWGAAPALLRPLRTLDDGSLRSGLVTLPTGWSGVAGAAPLTQIYVCSGTFEIGGRALSAGAWIVIGGGHQASCGSEEGCELIVILDAPSAATATRKPTFLVNDDVFAIEPFTPVIGGKPFAGFERRVLWLDPLTGADTRLLRVPGGFVGGGPNWHPVHEEIFCLEGDIQPDESRPMGAGSFLWNPAFAIHGFAERSVGGCLLLEWHDGPWSITLEPDAKRPAI